MLRGVGDIAPLPLVYDQLRHWGVGNKGSGGRVVHNKTSTRPSDRVALLLAAGGKYGVIGYTQVLLRACFGRGGS